MVKLKRDLNNRGQVNFEPVRPHIVYHALNYLKSYNKFYEGISITKGLSSGTCLSFPILLKFKDNLSVLKHRKYK